MSGRAMALSDHVLAQRPSRSVLIVAARKPGCALQSNGARIANGVSRPRKYRSRLMFVVRRVVMRGARLIPMRDMTNADVS